MTTNLNRRERKAAQLLKHYATCEALARHLGMSDPDGKKISVALFKIERDANNAACAQCNGETVNGQPYRDEEQWEAFKESITVRVAAVFGRSHKYPPPGFFYNTDPRGHALKIDRDETTPEILALNLPEDWGNYLLLSPEITGD